jgi:hypothetical protein
VVRRVQGVLGVLEFFLPKLLAAAYPAQWKRESLDDFRIPVARKTAEREAELIDLCLLISDQTWTAFYCRIRCRQDGTVIEWASCKIGVANPATGSLVRIPYGRPGTDRDTEAHALLAHVTGHLDSTDWTYLEERKALPE